MIFFRARCARGGCKLLEIELVRIYVPTCCSEIGKNRKERERGTEKERGREGRGKERNGKSNEFVFSLWFAVMGAFARGDCKLLETQIAQICVATCCFGKRETETERECQGRLQHRLAVGRRARGVAHSHLDTYASYTWILTVGYLRLLTCTCVLTLILALANLHLDT